MTGTSSTTLLPAALTRTPTAIMSVPGPGRMVDSIPMPGVAGTLDSTPCDRQGDDGNYEGTHNGARQEEGQGTCRASEVEEEPPIASSVSRSSSPARDRDTSPSSSSSSGGEPEKEVAIVVEECRICKEGGGGEMIKPCECGGTMARVHLKCLQQWISRRRHVNISEAGRCEICKADYKLRIKEGFKSGTLRGDYHGPVCFGAWLFHTHEGLSEVEEGKFSAGDNSPFTCTFAAARAGLMCASCWLDGERYPTTRLCSLSGEARG